MTRVLVVDDEEAIRFVFRKFLGDAGCDVIVASHKIDAMTMLASNEFDVAVVDYLLPDGYNGIELLKKIRQNQPFCEVILISGLPTKKTASEAASNDAFAYLAKPIRKDVIVQVVEEAFIERQKKRMEM